MGHHKVEANVLRINPLSANLTKWSNTLKQFVFYHFLVLGINGSILSIYHLFAHYCYRMISKISSSLMDHSRIWATNLKDEFQF